jgi:hypothetical protein
MISKCVRAARWCGVAAIGALVSAATPAALAGGGDPNFPGVNVDVISENATIIVPGITVPTSTYAAAGEPGTWNAFRNIIDNPRALFDLNGNPSTVVATLRSDNGFGTNCISGGITGGFQLLMCDYALNPAGVVNQIVFDVTGLPTGRYSLYTYAAEPTNTIPRNNFVRVSLDGSIVQTKTLTGILTTTSLIEGEAYTRHVFDVTGGQTLEVRIGDFSGEFGDTVFLNGFQIIRENPPVAEFIDPVPFDCVGDSVTLTGIATSNSGQPVDYDIDYSPDGNDPWIDIVSGSGDFPTPSNLGSWDTTGLPEGNYFLRLTVRDGIETTTAITSVYVNNVFDVVEETSASAADAVAGIVCFRGTINDRCIESYQVLWSDGGPFQPVDPSQPVYSGLVINNTFATWDTIGQGIPDGIYQIEIRAQATGAPLRVEGFELVVDNTAPTVQITSPEPCDTGGCGPVVINGVVDDANLESWTLQWATPDGTWETIASGTQPVNGLLGVLQFDEVTPCCTVLRLVASDSTIRDCNGVLNNNATTLTPIFIGEPADVDGNGVVDVLDLNLLLQKFNMPACP